MPGFSGTTATFRRLHPGGDFGWQTYPNVPDWRATLLASHRPTTAGPTPWPAATADVSLPRRTTPTSTAIPTGFRALLRRRCPGTLPGGWQWSAALGVDNLNNLQIFLFHPFPNARFLWELNLTTRPHPVLRLAACLLPVRAVILVWWRKGTCPRRQALRPELGTGAAFAPGRHPPGRGQGRSASAPPPQPGRRRHLVRDPVRVNAMPAIAADGDSRPNSPSPPTAESW